MFLFNEESVLNVVQNEKLYDVHDADNSDVESRVRVGDAGASHVVSKNV